MDDNSSSDDIQTRFKELASGYPTKLPRKLALLLPFKTQIEGLLARRASYDDIRLLLEDVKVVVSKDTVHRFCRQVIGQKPVRQSIAGAKEISPFKISPVQPSPETIQTTLREQRERFPGPWLRRKRGPRIADSKNQ
ncbi:MAG: hypothetical protein ACLP2Y_14715 [Limisphaerales bacterium]